MTVVARTTSTRRRSRTAMRALEPERVDMPLLLFFYSPTSGPCRRMDGLVSWLYVRERRRLRLRLVNVDICPELARRFAVTTVPTMILIRSHEVVARLEGRANGKQIDATFVPHLRAA
jgi:thioredoxin 2